MMELYNTANWEPTINFSLKLKFKKYPFELQKQIDKAVVTWLYVYDPWTVHYYHQ